MPTSEQTIQRIRELVGQGYTFKKVASDLGLSPRTVAKYGRGYTLVRRGPVTAEVEDMVLSLYGEGFSPQVAGATAGVSHPTALKILKKYEVYEGEERRVDEETLRQIQKLAAEGLTNTTIATRLGIDRHTVGKYRK